MIVYAGEDAEKGNIPPLLGVVQTCTTTLEINMVVFQKIGNQSTSISLLGIYPKDADPHHKIYKTLLIAALFIIARTWKQPRCPSAEEWIKKMSYIYTVEYYSAVKTMTS